MRKFRECVVLFYNKCHWHAIIYTKNNNQSWAKLSSTKISGTEYRVPGAASGPVTEAKVLYRQFDYWVGQVRYLKIPVFSSGNYNNAIHFSGYDTDRHWIAEGLTYRHAGCLANDRSIPYVTIRWQVTAKGLPFSMTTARWLSWLTCIHTERAQFQYTQRHNSMPGNGPTLSTWATLLNSVTEIVTSSWTYTRSSEMHSMINQHIGEYRQIAATKPTCVPNQSIKSLIHVDRPQRYKTLLTDKLG